MVKQLDYVAGGGTPLQQDQWELAVGGEEMMGERMPQEIQSVVREDQRAEGRKELME